MGLAVIVVLISLGMFFMLFFSLKGNTDFPARYDREQTTQNFVDAFIKTNVENCGATIDDIILDMINRQNPCRSARTPEEILGNASKYMLEHTFADAVPYEFSITVSGEADPRVFFSTCPATATLRDKPGIQDIPLLPTTRVATVQLVWCLK